MATFPGLKSGTYSIVNVKFRNFAVLPDANDGSELVGEFEGNGGGEKWSVTFISKDRYTIENHTFSRFAACNSYPSKEDNVEGRSQKKYWIIKECRVKGYFTIAPADSTELFWGLTDGNSSTPITLAQAATAPKNQWLFADLAPAGGENNHVATVDSSIRLVLPQRSGDKNGDPSPRLLGNSSSGDNVDDHADLEESWPLPFWQPGDDEDHTDLVNTDSRGDSAPRSGNQEVIGLTTPAVPRSERNVDAVPQGSATRSEESSYPSPPPVTYPPRGPDLVDSHSRSTLRSTVPQAEHAALIESARRPPPSSSSTSLSLRDHPQRLENQLGGDHAMRSEPALRHVQSEPPVATRSHSSPLPHSTGSFNPSSYPNPGAASAASSSVRPSKQSKSRRFCKFGLFCGSGNMMD